MFLKSDKELKTGLKGLEFELLVPANNKNIAIKAIKAGADAVYIGYSKYGARVQAGNSLEDLIDIIEFAHQYRVKIYITLNTILKNDELLKIEKLIWHLYNIKTDGIIIQDMGILELNLPPIPIIASTQCHNDSIEKIKFLEKTGFKRVILPRELSIKQIQEIRKQTNIELECFIHGALCVSYSGQCYLSYSIGGRSANRGECAQPCRRKYSLKDANGKYLIRDKYILSLKDLNLSNHIEELIKAGITSFKIEGRLKNETYVVNTTAYYRQVIDNVLSVLNLNRSSQGICTYDFEPDLSKTFNRGYTNFYINEEKNNLSTVDYNSNIGEFIGVVQSVKKNYFSLSNNILNNGDGICFFNENNELSGTNINKTEGNLIYPAEIKGIKQGTKIYRNYNRVFDNTLQNTVAERKIPVSIRIRETKFGYIFFLEDTEGNCAVEIISKTYEPAINKDKAKTTIEVQLSKTGGSIFKVVKIDIKLKNIPFIKVSAINEIRRQLINKLIKIRKKNFKQSIRENPLTITKYPLSELNYKSNIYNDKAEMFYKKRGAFVKERAFESLNNHKGKELMVSKYCLKKQFGICPKQTNIKKYSEPFTLTDEFNKEYLVEFNCKECVMKIINKD